MLVRVTALMVIALTLSGCVIVADVDSDWSWDGRWVERKQTVEEDIAGVEFNAPGTLYITQGRRSALRLEGNEEALEELRIDERDGTLIITQAGETYRWFELRGKNAEPVYTLEISELEKISHSGHGTINVGPFTLDKLDVKTDGHAQTYIASINARDVNVSVADHGRVRVETLDSDAMLLNAADHGDIYVQDASVLDADIHTQSHGEVWLAGQADSLTLNMRGHSDLEAHRFASAIATVTARDHAQAQLAVSDEIHLDERDNASVVVTGTPRISARD